jgi:hypothetical protein
MLLSIRFRSTTLYLLLLKIYCCNAPLADVLFIAEMLDAPSGLITATDGLESCAAGNTAQISAVKHSAAALKPVRKLIMDSPKQKLHQSDNLLLAHGD